MTVDYEMTIQSLLDELNELKDSFETKWSKNTSIIIKLFIADTICRYCALCLKNHRSKFPCFRCYIFYDQKLNFPLPTSDEIVLRKLDDYLRDTLSKKKI